MSSKFVNAIKGLRYLPSVLSSMGDSFRLFLKSIKVYRENLSYKSVFKKYLKCDVGYLASVYRHMGHTHVELLAHNGVFISSSHSLDTIYPKITVLDDNVKSFKNLEQILSGSFVGCNLIKHNPITEELLLFDTPLDSVALPFVLELLPNLQSIENLLTVYRDQLHPVKGGVIFGFTAIYSQGKRQLMDQYINVLAKRGFTSFNKELSIQQLADIFDKLFHEVTRYQRGAC